MGYKRASKKQLAYIDSLSAVLGVSNPTLYTKYSLEQAARLIRKLHRLQTKQRRERQRARQLRLL